MSVVVNGRFLPQRPGGLQRTARSLLQALAPQLPLDVVSPRPDPLASVVLAAPGGRLGGQLWEQVLLPRHARGRRLLSLANTAPLAAGASVVLVHDLAPLVGPQWFHPSMRAYGRLVLTGARRAELVLTVSQAVRGELLARGVRRVEVVRPAVDPLFAPAPAADVARVRERYGRYALVVGWADPRKDLATAVAAHLAVAPALPHRLLLVGGRRGVFAPVAVPRAPSVEVLDHVGDEALRALLTAADVLLYPSRYEGFGLPPLEAAACGTPSLVSDLPVLRESAGGSATFVAAGDVAAWARALRTALEAPAPPGGGPEPRTWDDVAREVAALLS
ncbi:MAG: glycosyltransferase family 4 protein [Mycobacteriales bacterium]